MAFAAPAWQTDELGEEWVETSPSPPGSPSAAATADISDQPLPSQASVSAKRGSLRSLGQAPARPLPPSRKNSLNGGPEYARSPSNPYVRSASGMLSPPTSVSGSEGGDRDRDREHVAAVDGKENATQSVTTERAAGTFLVKDGEDTHGKAFPKNPFGRAADMFQALALERMFDPPTPPAATGNTSRVTTKDQSAHLDAVPEESSTPQASPASDGTVPSEFPVIPSPEEVEDDESALLSSPSPPQGSMKELPSSDDSLSSPASSEDASLSPTPSPAMQLAPERRVSHAYAPTNPSRLCKSVTPSDSSFVTTEAATHDTTNLSLPCNPEDDTIYTSGAPSAVEAEHPHHLVEDEPQEAPADDYESMVETTVDDQSFEVASPPLSPSHPPKQPESPLSNPKYPFTFSAPARSNDSLEFDPSLEPLNGGEPSHSTLRIRPGATNPGLRLFRNAYDTVTREHLSALVDSIAIQPSPSPPSMPNAKDLREWSPAADESPIRSNSSGSRTVSTPSSGSVMSDARSSKRLRLSPPSPQRRPPVRDWRAEGRALLDRIRDAKTESSISDTTRSATRSWDSPDASDNGSWDSGEDRTRDLRSATAPTVDGSDYYGMPTVDYAHVPSPTPPVEAPPVEEEPRMPSWKRSNPSTASSNYLQRAEELMARIKARPVSPATSTMDSSATEAHRALSQSSTQTWASSEVEVSRPALRGAARRSPQRLLRRRSQAEEAERTTEEEEDSYESSEAAGSATRAVSRTSVEGSGPPPSAPNRDDLNRFISASTYATATTASTSFVKHRGPRDSNAKPAMTTLRPDDVQGVVHERVGKMRWDQTTMRWIREPLDRVDEAGESRLGSDDSADPFAGFESVGSPERLSSPERPERSATSMRTVQSIDWDHSDEVELHDDLDATPRPAARVNVYPASPAAALKTPTPALGATPPGPLRSAMRNANSTPASALRRAAWHPDLTPAPDQPGSAERSRRSVSFSDQYIAPPAQQQQQQPTHKRRASRDNDLFDHSAEETPSVTNASWLPSARTRRIRGALEEMAELSLDESPSKPPQREPTKARPQPVLDNTVEEEPTEEDTDDTVPMSRFRSFRSYRGTSRGCGDATFLTECSFGVAHDRLVHLITEVQPFEPYWENLRSIDLSNKGVESLARMKEFLPMLDEARLSDNMIDYLSGVPSTVRTLFVAGNRLSSLTSMSHLRNIQYLDVSRNQLDSLAQLSVLTHLRELNANGNSISDLDGIFELDSLLKVSVAGNHIERVDFDQAKWDKLETLNLSNNRIGVVKGLHRLVSATSINLEKNRLTELDPAEPLPAVRVLRFSDNDVSHIDLSHFPKLRTLFADGNALPGLSRSMATGGHRLENLSLRSQRVGRITLTPEDLQSVKRLYVSGNRLDTDFLPASPPLFNLAYLEAAACNFTSWPADLSARAPNLRILNVNYNFLPDLKGLQGLVYMRKLMIVGNRLGGSGGKGAVRGLKGLSALEEVDLRMNPSTLSFYLPIMLPRGKSSSSATEVAADNNWPVLDAQFRRQLPDEWYSKRLVYRGLVMAACPELHMLDGVKVQEGERRKAAMLLEYASEASLQ